MKISKEFVLREIAGVYVIVPTGEAAFRFQGLITVNDTGAFLWNKLQEGEKTEADLTDALCNEYETDRTEAAGDVAEFLRTLREHNILAKK